MRMRLLRLGGLSAVNIAVAVAPALLLFLTPSCDPTYLDGIILPAPSDAGADGDACPSPTCADGAFDCPDGLVSCNGECVDLTLESEHCGGCGFLCKAPAICAD